MPLTSLKRLRYIPMHLLIQEAVSHKGQPYQEVKAFTGVFTKVFTGLNTMQCYKRIYHYHDLRKH